MNKNKQFLNLVESIPYSRWTDRWLDKFFEYEKQVFGDNVTKEDESFIAHIFCEEFDEQNIPF